MRKSVSLQQTVPKAKAGLQKCQDYNIHYKKLYVLHFYKYTDNWSFFKEYIGTYIPSLFTFILLTMHIKYIHIQLVFIMQELRMLSTIGPS